MSTSVPTISTQTQQADNELKRPLQLATVGFALFLAGAATTMAIAGLFDPVLLALAGAINVVLMLAICLSTAVVLDLGADPEEGGTRRSRILRRMLHLAALYWAAAGLAFLLSPLLAQL
jgi:hypothetical protein